jgi:hypothetical protein
VSTDEGQEQPDTPGAPLDGRSLGPSGRDTTDAGPADAGPADGAPVAGARVDGVRVDLMDGCGFVLVEGPQRWMRSYRVARTR